MCVGKQPEGGVWRKKSLQSDAEEEEKRNEFHGGNCCRFFPARVIDYELVVFEKETDVRDVEP
jgi:hypothetical protein